MPDEDEDRPRRGRLRDDESAEDDRPRRSRRRSDDPDYDPDEDDRRPRAEEDFNPAGLIVPLGASPWSIISCYSGLLGICVPVFGVVALVTGILALRSRKKQAATYGNVTSDIRAWVGVACGIWGTIYTLGIIVVFAVQAANGKL